MINAAKSFFRSADAAFRHMALDMDCYFRDVKRMMNRLPRDGPDATPIPVVPRDPSRNTQGDRELLVSESHRVYNPRRPKAPP
jgi:hypothetical protein